MQGNPRYAGTRLGHVILSEAKRKRAEALSEAKGQSKDSFALLGTASFAGQGTEDERPFDFAQGDKLR